MSFNVLQRGNFKKQKRFIEVYLAFHSMICRSKFIKDYMSTTFWSCVILWPQVQSLKLVIVWVFPPGKLSNVINEGLFLGESVVKYISATTCYNQLFFCNRPFLLYGVEE